MKTSLNIDDFLFKEAKKEALATKRTIGEVISHWASIGKKALNQKSKSKKFEPVSLGKQRMDFSNRKNWMEEIE